MSPLTASAHTVAVLDLTEDIMVTDWLAALTMEPRPTHPGAYAQRAEFVVGLIAAAVTFEPRHGLPMDLCDRPGCDTFVDDNARRPDGRLYCSAAHEDADSEDADERTRARLLADGGHDVGRCAA